ncbi:MAG: class I SAM-dependent methyltransferase [Nannocystaceae bacterium]|nr:class I SAM-dependent methyltransferase [bacterium]
MTDNVVGNHYDKYGTRNPIARALMSGFIGAATSLYRLAAADTVLEVGCGEGELAQTLLASGPAPSRFEITDLDIGRVPSELPAPLQARQASVYELPYADDAFDLVVCCEVLEHLEDPEQGLREVARVAKHRVLLSTPWEPMWRAMNMARGKYLTDLGNTPGHVQHFTRRGLVELASKHLSILQRRRPLPWTMLLGAPLR